MFVDFNELWTFGKCLKAARKLVILFIFLPGKYIWATNSERLLSFSSTDTQNTLCNTNNTQYVYLLKLRVV